MNVKNDSMAAEQGRISMAAKPFAKKKLTLYKASTGYLYIFPALLLLSVFVFFPVILNILYSFYQWSAFSTKKIFVGLEYYKKLFTDPVFYTCLKDNSLYAGISLVFQVCTGLVIAAILESVFIRKASTFFRTLFFIPSVISFTVVGLLWRFFYNPTIGPFNQVLNLLGIHTGKIDILGNASTSLFGVIGASQWQWFGYMAMLLIVAMQNVPRDLYDAAAIDGSGPINTFFHITIPQIKEMLLVTCIITVVGSFKLFDEVYIMTSGGPGYSSEVLSTYLYRTAFRSDLMGYASALGTILFVITFILSVVQILISRTGKE